MLHNKLIAWSNDLRKEVNKKQPKAKKVFNPKTRPDFEFDNTMRNLPTEVIQDIKAKIRDEFAGPSVDLSHENIRGIAAEAVGDCLKLSPCLRLDLSGNYIRDVDLELVLKNLHHKSIKLQEMNLSNNRIGIEGAKKLAEMLIWNKSLRKLNIDTNNITGSGIEFLARAIAKNDHLTSFSANWNQLDLFAEEFYFTLSKNRMLRTLKLGYCNLDDDVAEAIADGLGENSSLEEIFLFGNVITDNGAMLILDALFDNCTLKYINMANNLLTDISGTQYSQMIICKANKNLEFFANLKHNNLSPSVEEEFEAIRQTRNRKITRCESAINPIERGSFTNQSEVHDDDRRRQRQSWYDDSDDAAEYAQFFNNRFYQVSAPQDEEASVKYDGENSVILGDDGPNDDDDFESVVSTHSDL